MHPPQAAGNTGIWTLVSGSGVIQNANNPNTTVSNLGLGANVFKWTVTNGACPEAFSQVTITRTAAPSQAVAGTDVQTCATSAILAAVPPTVGAGFWTVSVGAGIIDNPSSATSAVNGLSPGLNSLIWTVSSGTCPSTSDTVSILVDQNPTSASAGSDQQVCSTVSNFEATAPTVGTGVWTVISGTGTIAQINTANSSVSNLAIGPNVFRWTVTNGSCVTFDEVTITRFVLPTVASAGLDQTICAASVQLTGQQSKCWNWRLVDHHRLWNHRQQQELQAPMFRIWHLEQMFSAGQSATGRVLHHPTRLRSSGSFHHLQPWQEAMQMFVEAI
jgi:hypothetical protein